MSYYHRVKTMKLAPVDRRMSFEQAVINRLEAKSVNHAITLRRMGMGLGWWETCEQMRLSDCSVDDVVNYIVSQEALYKLAM
jgi:hypothetical protein